MVAGAINVSRGMLEFRADPSGASYEPRFDKEKPVIVYCASGGRSALGGKALKELGYGQVYNGLRARANIPAIRGWALAAVLTAASG